MSYQLALAKKNLGMRLTEVDQYYLNKGLMDGAVSAMAPTIKGTASERIKHHKEQEVLALGAAIGSPKSLKSMYQMRAQNHLMMRTALENGLEQGKDLKAEDLNRKEGLFSEAKELHHARLDGIEESLKKQPARVALANPEISAELDRLRAHHEAAGTMSKDEMASHDWTNHAIQNVIDNHKAASDPEFEKEHKRGPDGSFRKMTEAEKDVVPNKDDKKD